MYLDSVFGELLVYNEVKYNVFYYILSIQVYLTDNNIY